MSDPPTRCVVDTNVPATANRANPAASDECVAACARALLEVTKNGHLFVDDGDRIVDEYRANLRASGEPNVGDLFFKWVLTNQYVDERVTRVVITPKDESFQELPAPSDGTVYDHSDRKFLAVSAAHPEHPSILQALDSKWWGWTKALSAAGVSVHFLCEHEIEAIYRRKMGSD